MQQRWPGQRSTATWRRLLAAAGKAWVSVLAGKFQAADVEAAARGLNAVGMPWEGARLAGHAAARADERKDMMRLLSCARDLHPQGSSGRAETAGRTTEVRNAPAADQAMARPAGCLSAERTRKRSGTGWCWKAKRTGKSGKQSTSPRVPPSTTLPGCAAGWGLKTAPTCWSG